MNKHKEDVQIANKYMKRCSVSLVTENQNQKWRSLPVRMPTSRKQGKKSECWGECGQNGTLIDCWWECKLVHPIWETVQKFLKLKI